MQQNVGQITETDTRLGIDSTKMHQERGHVENLSVPLEPVNPAPSRLCTYFHGRKDQTFAGRSSTKKEEHVAEVVELKCLAYFTPESGRAIHQAKHLTYIAFDNAADMLS